MSIWLVEVLEDIRIKQLNIQTLVQDFNELLKTDNKQSTYHNTDEYTWKKILLILPNNMQKLTCLSKCLSSNNSADKLTWHKSLWLLSSSNFAIEEGNDAESILISFQIIYYDYIWEIHLEMFLNYDGVNVEAHSEGILQRALTAMHMHGG